jgi:hypothetical protein
MNKRHLHHTWTRFRQVKPWYFLGLTIVFGVISVAALYHNNKQMLTLRDAVFAADKSGQGVQESLQSLQRYVTAHMNTNLAIDKGVYPPIQLQYSYDRLVKSAGDKVAQENQTQYNDAVNHCPSSGESYQQHLDQQNCVVTYMSDKHNIRLQSIPSALYEFNFISPTWSPDLAGWSIALTALSAGCFVLSFVVRSWFKRATN